MSKTIFHSADSRGKADHGWLKSYHTFSFARYYNPERMNFGALRVLNDDTVEGGKGFGEHPHDNMEIISIPLKGSLKHEDSMDNVAVISDGEIQVMSAGTGIYHQENNNSSNESVQFLQIWIYPNVLNVKPRYDQMKLDRKDRHNQLQEILSPYPGDSSKKTVWIYQKSWFHLADLDKGVQTDYTVKAEGNGVYVFIIKGSVKIGEQILNTRDGYGLWEIEKFTLEASENSEFLLMEVPMTF